MDSIQESIEFINSRPKPLAIYAFTKDETFKKQILTETSSGSVTFNDTLVQVLIHLSTFFLLVLGKDDKKRSKAYLFEFLLILQFLCDNLPFGGVGQSGFGRYHGKYSFDTFSHEKAVLERSFYLELEPRHPPWNEFKMQFIRLAYNFDYFRLALLLSGLKRKFT